MNDGILKEVSAELERQAALAFHGNTADFDKTNSLIKVAALAVSAIKAHDAGYCK